MLEKRRTLEVGSFIILVYVKGGSLCLSFGHLVDTNRRSCHKIRLLRLVEDISVLISPFTSSLEIPRNIIYRERISKARDAWAWHFLGNNKLCRVLVSCFYRVIRLQSFTVRWANTVEVPGWGGGEVFLALFIECHVFIALYLSLTSSLSLFVSVEKIQRLLNRLLRYFAAYRLK